MFPYWKQKKERRVDGVDMEKLLREILFELNRIKRLLRTIASNTEQARSYSEFVESLSSTKSLVNTENNISEVKDCDKDNIDRS